MTQNSDLTMMMIHRDLKLVDDASVPCQQQAILNSHSATEKSGMYQDNPIVLKQQKGDGLVTFQIKQTWKEGGTLDSLAVLFEAPEGVRCAESIHYGQDKLDEEYTAQCTSDGVASVTLFIQDKSLFQGLALGDDMLPPICPLTLNSDGGENVVLYRFTVPCDPTNASFCLSHPPELSRACNTSHDTFCEGKLPVTVPLSPPVNVPTQVQPPPTSCHQQARLDDTSVQPGKGGMYLSPPISLLAQSGTTVQFEVLQTWKTSGTVGLVSVLYKAADGTNRCEERDNYGTSLQRVEAQCTSDGVAFITLFVRDSSFYGYEAGDDVLPPLCTLVSNGSAEDLVIFKFSVPCNAHDMTYCAKGNPPESYPSATIAASPIIEERDEGVSVLPAISMILAVGVILFFIVGFRRHRRKHKAFERSTETPSNYTYEGIYSDNIEPNSLEARGREYLDKGTGCTAERYHDALASPQIV